MTCDKCHKDITMSFKVGSSRFCEPCYGPRQSQPLDFGIKLSPSNFEPHFDPILKCWVSTWAEKRKLLESKKSSEHPDGYHLLNEYPEKIKEYKKIRENREEIIKESYAKAGFKYVPGSNVRLDKQTKSFVPSHSPNPWKRKWF